MRRRKARTGEMDLQRVCLPGYFSVSPLPLEKEKARESEKKGGVEQQCLVSSNSGSGDGDETGSKRSETKLQDDKGPALEGLSLAEEEGGRERLKRHRREMAGRVWIPEIWGQEELMKDWIDCSAFDACLFPSGIGSARAALVEEGRRANNGGFRLENRC